MAITDLQISEELQTGAPSIKYRGNEGPQSPQEEQQMVGQDYSSPQYRMKLIAKLMQQGLDFGAASNEADRLIKLMLDRQRQGSAEGGRAEYGLGSIVRSITRPIKKIAKSPVGKAALTAAAMYYAPTMFGSLGKAATLGERARWWKGVPKFLGTKMFGSPATLTDWPGTSRKFMMAPKTPGWLGKWGLTKGGGSLMPTGKGILTAASLLPFTGIGMGEEENLNLGLNIPDSQKFGQSFSQMRKDIADAVDSGVEENFHEVLNKYGLTEGVNINYWEDIRKPSAQGGRIGYYSGGQSIPSTNSLEDARKTAMQDRLGGITEVMKLADLYRQGDVGQMYMAEGGGTGSRNRMSELMFKLANGTITEEEIIELRNIESSSVFSKGKAQGGRIGYADAGKVFASQLKPSNSDIGISSLFKDKDFMINLITQLKREGKSSEEIINQIRSMVAEPMAPAIPRKEIREPFYPHKSEGIEIREPFYPDRFEGKEIREPFYPDRFEGLKPQLMAEGGLMNLGGMEKDYRETGGFVDLGAEEKADDVPARLSVNEFVMTADAVRGAGGGDIDKGAEIMERVMKNLEEGGRISEESQGLTNRRQGASDMFEVSERLSEVV